MPSAILLADQILQEGDETKPPLFIASVQTQSLLCVNKDERQELRQAIDTKKKCDLVGWQQTIKKYLRVISV